MTDGDVALATAVERAYQRTRDRFDAWASAQTHREYVVPASTAPSAGFAIFYTPPAMRPNLLVVGQNPSNFAGKGRPLSEAPNAIMLAGEPPDANSYENHEHLFGIALRDTLRNYPKLQSGIVGMNVWHFQCVSKADKAPSDLRAFCETTTKSLIDAMRPANVLCFGRPAFDALAGSSRRMVDGAKRAKVARRDGTTLWYVPHLTGAFSRPNALHDLPIVLDAMTA